jgi:predicted nucleic acid-binding protein
MPIISNTSPLLNLAIIDHLHLLRQQFGQIFIPPPVLAELKPDTGYPGVERLEQALAAAWIRVIELKDNRLAQVLMLELDQGEAATIALALEQGYNQILMDERDGRAKALGLTPVGVLGVLLRAKREGELVSVKEVMQSLRTEAGFFIADHLFEAILVEAGEQ